MNSVTLGLWELARLLDRLSCRLRLFSQRRQLGRLESRLGLLGWQQADYDPTTQRHVDRLTGYERTQGQLTNESAAVGLTLRQLEERRTTGRTTFEGQRAERQTVLAPLVKSVEDSEKNLAAKTQERKALEEQMAVLDSERIAAEEKYRSLLAEGTNDAGQGTEVQRWQRRVASLPREKQEWQAKLTALAPALSRLEVEVREQRARVSVETEALRTLEKSFAESDEALAREIAARQREKQKIERQIDDLEKAKTQPYREIGRVLADQGIEPVNQPEALTAVLAQRERIANREAKLQASLARSRREKRLDVWSSWLLLLTLAVLLAGSILTLIRLW